MRKLLLAFLMIALAVPALAAGPWKASAVLTGGEGAADNTLSAAVTLPSTATLAGRVKSISLYVPTITSATVQVYGSVDGTNFYPIHCFTNGTNMVAQTSAAGTGGFTMNLPGIDARVFTHLKVKTGAAQAADRTFVFTGIQ